MKVRSKMKFIPLYQFYKIENLYKGNTMQFFKEINPKFGRWLEEINNKYVRNEEYGIAGRR